MIVFGIVLHYAGFLHVLYVCLRILLCIAVLYVFFFLLSVYSFVLLVVTFMLPIFLVVRFFVVVAHWNFCLLSLVSV